MKETKIYTNDIHNIRDTIQNSFIMKCDQIIREKIIRRGLKMTQILRFSDKDIVTEKSRYVTMFNELKDICS